MKSLREMDQWEVLPTFYYNEISKSLKSHFNGIIFLIFAILALIFFFLQLVFFIIDIDLLVSSRTEDVQLSKINITTIDAFFGIGLYKAGNDSMTYFNRSEVEKYFNVTFTLVSNDIDLTTNIPYEKCEAEDFFDSLEWDRFSNSFKDTLKEQLVNNSCPYKNKSIFLEINNLTQSASYIRIIISLRKDKFKEALELITNNQIYVQILYANYFIDTKNRFQPFKSQIKYNEMGINPNLYRYFLLEISKYQIYDDVSLLPSRDYRLYKNSKFKYDTGSYYSIDEKYSQVVKFYANRTREDDILINFYISLSENSKTIYRDFPKLTTFLAGTNSIISAIFAVISIISRFINTTFMNLSMTRKRMYSKEISDFSKIYLKIEQRSSDSNNSFSKKKIDQDVLEIPEKKQFESEFQTTINDRNSVLCKKNIREKYLDKFLEQEINECKFYQLFLCFKHKNLGNISLDSRMDKVLSTLNIEKYIQIHDEFNFLKKILFDKDHLITFELLSKLENCFFNMSNEEKLTTSEIIVSLQNIISSKEKNNYNLKKFLIKENDIRENEYIQNDYYSSNVI